MKNSLKNRILIFFRNNPGWHHKGDIETLAKNGTFGKPSSDAAGYLGETADRRLRELQKEGKLKYDDTREGFYSAEPKQTITYTIRGTNEVVSSQKLW